MEDWRVRVIWAKKARGSQESRWLPLVTHMADAAETARLLWHNWLPASTKRKIADGLGLEMGDAADYDEAALPCFIFLAAAHDLGKAIPAFQSRLGLFEVDEQISRQLTDAGLPLLDYFHPREARHFWASQLILEKAGFHRELAVILGAHHGQPPGYTQLYNLKKSYLADLGWKQGHEAWQESQQELLMYALKLARAAETEARSWRPNITAQVLLSGLVIMVDWIVSNEDLFPYLDLYEGIKSSEVRANNAWQGLELPECWSPDDGWMGAGGDLYEKRFGIEEPRPVQSAMLEIAGNLSHPGIVILEAPMGEGKTEAALAAAEALVEKTKRSGIFFALPTQATTNGLFPRVVDWIRRLESEVAHIVHLAHGKADLNELYSEIRSVSQKTEGRWGIGDEGEGTGDDPIIVHEWFAGRKKGILADFVIGTIDQVLMAALKHKHLALRHLGLANKVVIIDECHAYDTYMSQYLYRVLNWLGAYGVPVIILSATLPGDRREQLCSAYLDRELAEIREYDPLFDEEKPEDAPPPPWATTLEYPIITYSVGKGVEQKKIEGRQREQEVTLKILPDDKQITPLLTELLTGGGCAGIITNTVRRAQEIASALKESFGDDVFLLHSRFLAMDRARAEKDLFSRLGAGGHRPARYIAVGTQIFEQSCDLDFDVLITDICPMDLLIQRIGRLHRHRRNRPPKLTNPTCYITGMDDTGFDRGAELVYGKYLLMNTRELLPGRLELPGDIPRLVQGVYSPEGVKIAPGLQSQYGVAREAEDHKTHNKTAKAGTFQIAHPFRGGSDLVGWLDIGITSDPTGKRGEAAVRDIENTLEVLVVQRSKGEYRMLPWLAKHGGRRIPVHEPPGGELAKAMAECSIQLPRELCFRLDDTIEELETIALGEIYEWQKSPWLKGELFLVLDEQLTVKLCGYRLHYDQAYGMISRKIKEGDHTA